MGRSSVASSSAYLTGVLLFGAAARCLFAVVDDGIHWPDEIYQALEPAHRAVFGYGWQAWEFLEGARHWTLPGVVAAVLAGAKAVGLDEPGQYLLLVRLVFCAAGVATVWAVRRLALALGASERSALLGAWAFAAMGLAVYFAPRAMGETLSALPVTVAFALIAGRDASRRAVIVAGLLLSLATWLRLQHGLFAIAALVTLFTQGRRRETGVLLGVLALGAVGYGLVDWASWGAPFHSAWTYLRFNVLEGRSGNFGKAHVFHYVFSLVTSEGLVVLPLAVLAAFAKPRWLTWTMLGFLGVHSLIPHKELRFVFPLVPLVCAQAAVGLDEVLRRRPTWTKGLAALLVLAPLLSLALLPTLTFGRLGIRNPPRETPALDFAGPENRLLLRAHGLGDLCGLKITSIEHWRTGGFSYLHREVPMYGQAPGLGEGHYNYVIARRGEVAGDEVAVDHGIALVRTTLPCAPDPGYRWALE